MVEMIEKFNGLKRTNSEVKPCNLIFCADHGVADENVSAYPKRTTAQMVRNYLEFKGAAANAFASYADSTLLVVDVGVDDDLEGLEGLIRRKIMRGTNNIMKGPAMTIEQAMTAINVGLEVGETLIKAGYNCFLPGEMGIANTTSAAAMTAMILNVDPESVTGRGTNISDERLAHKIEVVKRAIEVNSSGLGKNISRKRRAVEILSRVGGLEIAAIAGLILAAGKNDSLVILDGFNTAVAALIAHEIEPSVCECLIASHIGREKGHKIILDYLKLNPILNLNLALGEAIGSSIIYRVLDNFTRQSVEDDDNDDDEDFEDDDEYITIDDYNDDDDFEIELNIFNGGGADQRYNDDFDEECIVDFKELDDSNISVTDRTFNFYLNTMPILDKAAMQRAQSHVDSLSKPYGSLGILEEIFIQLAGISSESQISHRLRGNIICFTDNVSEVQNFKDCYEAEEDFDVDNILMDTYETAESFNVDLTVALLSDVNDSTTAFDFGRMTAEDVSFKVPIIGITLVGEDGEGGINEQFQNGFLTASDKLRYRPEEFLRYVSKGDRGLVSAVIGAIISAAHNSSLVIVDVGAVDIIARYVESLCPGVVPYILHSSKIFNDAYNLDLLEGEGASIAIEVVRGALHSMNEMKSFEETGVSVAIDGRGAFHN